ncbi:SH3 domain-containing protein [[Brevibacterium] frigoritolerans]|uniref:SH3 domain-containing protein n=1 Tax=Peribacillus frigoritolerans TaxID=450367 RepID=A0A941J5X9_9BACI|nr:SH3 domain-containing protein [Peribacillus frigoritolerans]
MNVSTGSLNMRKSRSDSASIVAKLTRGTQVTVYSESKAGRKSKPMERMDMSARSIYRQRSLER